MTKFLRALLATASAVALSAEPACAINVERPAMHGQPVSQPPPPPPSGAYSVYPGCTVPPATSTGSTWYFDPVNGKTPAYYVANPPGTGIAGDQQHPWNKLVGAISGLWGTANVTANVTYPGYSRPLLSSVPFIHFTTTGEAGLVPGEAIGKVFAADNTGNPPIHPGDTILLMSGDYGALQIGAPNLKTVNPAFVTIEPAPGATPVIDSMLVFAVNKWIFNGLTFQSIRTVPAVNQPLVNVRDGGSSYPTADIVFANLTLSSAPNSTTLTWTAANWYALARSGFEIIGSVGNGTNGQPYTSCVSVTNSHITNAYQGAVLGANSILFDHNEIDHTVEDMLDYLGSNLTITHNYLHDEETAGDGNHNDGMQGQAGPLAAGVTVDKYSNILIDSNIVIRRTDPHLALPSPQGLQGIDAFDSDWTNFVVTNNVVITRSCWGMSFASIHNGLIAGNTVLDDGDTSVVEPGCAPTLAVGPTTHQGTASNNTRVSNNLADTFEIADNPTTGVTFDHNVALNFYQGIQGYINGVWSYQWPARTDANGNIAPAANVPYAAQFNTWLPLSWQYNVRLLPGSVAIGAGTSGSPLPTVDTLGVTRTSPYTVGAYGYPN